MIVVLDTNVWISALHFASRKGTATRVLERAITQDTIAICAPAENEIHRILTSKFHWHPDQVARALRIALERAHHTSLTGNVHLCRDPDDDIFLDCALAAHADILVSGDKDLLILGSIESTRILTPADYLAL